MSELILDLADRLNWNLVAREIREATQISINPATYSKIGAIAVSANSRILAAGCLNPIAKDSWQLGGWISARIPVTPSATSEFNLGDTTGLMEFAKISVPLRRLKLIFLPKIQPTPYTLLLETPKWHRQILWEVWEYDGVDLEKIQEDLARIETKIDGLS